MRLIALARIAAEAEGLRLKAMAGRQARRGAWGLTAATFGLLLAVMLHIAAMFFLLPAVGGGFAALILAGADLLLAALFTVLAARKALSAEEREAIRISRQARAYLADSAKTFALVAPVARAVGGNGLVSMALTQWLRRKRRT